MQTLSKILNNESTLGPLRLEKQSRGIDPRDTFFILKYAHLSKNRPIHSLIKTLRNKYNLKWLRPRVVHSRHTNLQEKLLGDLKHKLLLDITDADYGTRPCNCPQQFLVDGKCAFGNDSSCRTAGVVYKISCCASANCHCFYIGKSQHYVKKRIQEHIGEVTKLYSNLILQTHRPRRAHHFSQTLQTTTTTLSKSTRFSSAAITQSSSILPPTYPPRCIFINNTSPSQPLDRTLRIHLCPRSHLSDLSDSSIDNSTHNIVPIPPQDIPSFPPDPPNTQPDACFALARPLLSHAKDPSFASKADVATWCRSNIKVDILWQSNTIGLMSTAGTRSCHLCAAERMLIGQNLRSTRWMKGLLNLKSEMHGICNCKTRFLRFSRPGQEGGL
jgi:hypothetical protein